MTKKLAMEFIPLLPVTGLNLRLLYRFTCPINTEWKETQISNVISVIDLDYRFLNFAIETWKNMVLSPYKEISPPQEAIDLANVCVDEVNIFECKIIQCKMIGGP